MGPAEAAPAPQTIPLDMVVAVDESGSLSADDVSREIAATSTITEGVLNPQSRVTVLGFGSDNGQAGQNAVDAVCRPTVVDGAVSMQYLATCAKGLHRRTDAEGNDTDHVAALSQSLSTLRSGSPPNALKVIFLLTDGRLDVHRSPSYGSGDDNDPEVARRRNDAAKAQLKTMLGQAQQDNAQIWPLGFGAEATQAGLDAFAAGGSRQGCDGRNVSQPTARIVHDSQDVSRSLSEAYAAAACMGMHQTPPQPLGPGETRNLRLDIPLIATDGTITVDKGDPRVRAEFIDPKGRTVPTSGKIDDSTFSRSGGNAAVEALRIVNPVNGTWTVRLTAPKKLARQLVSATAFWQGAVQATIVPEPPVARAGQRVTVRLSLVTRRGAITDENALRGLTFSVTASGPGPSARQDIAVRDDGRAPDDTAHDGRFAGTFTAPPGAGDVSLSGTVSGPAIRAERVPVTVRVDANEPVLRGNVQFDDRTTVHPGGVVHGRLTLRNGTTTPRRVRLALDGAPDARAALSPAGDIDMPPGDSTRDFSVAFGKDAGLGGASLTVKVVDAADPSAVYANGLLTVTVKNPPTWWDKARPYVAGAVALLLLLALILWLRHRAWKRRVGVAGLHVRLTHEGEQVGREVAAPRKWSQEFRFTLHDPDGYGPTLRLPLPGDTGSVYVARRRGDGAVALRTPGGEEAVLPFGTESEPLASGHRIAFRDTRRPRRFRWPWRRPKPRPAPRPAPDPDSPTGPRPPQPTPDDDIWF
ncbi:vWA domain-containing protein [Actinoallomurus sp. NPDC052308]|uniref:vWA domain-containing protein n=1 Tax=Actinoallomurus sp. NPDC052308 TaxID=3155530 RepID=UPI00343829DD